MDFIDQIKEIIVSRVRPDKIILFGSYARGDYNLNSDVDLLVLKKGLTSERVIEGDLYLDFFKKDVLVPVDVIVMDYHKFYRLSDEIGYIYKDIKQEGKVIYESIQRMAG